MSEDKDMWIYHGKCYPKNLPQFPLSEYLYIGQTNDPENRSKQHMIEDKNNSKFELLRSLTLPKDWEFKFRRVERREGESQKNYMNRVGIQEKKEIRDFKTNYCRHGWNTYGLNASDGGEHPGNGGYRCNIPGQTSGVKNIVYDKTDNIYCYMKTFWCNGECIGSKKFFASRNLFLVYLYAKFCGEKDIIVDKSVFWSNVWNFWKDENVSYCKNVLGIKTVHIENTHNKKFQIRYRNRGEGVNISRVSPSNFLMLYEQGVLDKNDIFCLDFFVWNMKLALEGNFDIKNSKPLLFYDDFLRFREIHHFSVDDLDAAIKFLREVEIMVKNSFLIGQQILQCN